MPRPAVEDNSRMSLRIPAEEKALLLRAALQIVDEVLEGNRRATKARHSVHDFGVDHNCWLSHGPSHSNPSETLRNC
jgi:hypothetical protein